MKKLIFQDLTSLLCLLCALPLLCKRILCLIASIPLLLFLSQVVAAASTFIEPAYEIIDTGILGRREVYWIDNQRLLFAGYDPTRLMASGPGTSPQSVLYIWDLKTQQAKIHADIPETDQVCYSDGFVSYAVSKGGERYIREGKLGAEKERKWNPPAPGSKIKIDFNELSCKDIDLLAMDKIYPGYWFIPLREGHGYRGGQKRETSEKVPETPWFYLPAGKGKKPIALPVSKMDRISYSEYLSAYVIEDTPSQRTKDTSGKMWLLYLDGKITESIVPAGPWMHPTWGYAPTRKGWSISSRATGRKSNFDPGDAGIYLMNDSKMERLIIGLPGTPAVSPDGCKIGAVVHPLTAPGLKATVRIINLCKQGE